MTEKILSLQREYDWSPGVKQDFWIMESLERVGQLSVVRFEVKYPYPTNWLYLAKIEVDMARRHQHIGTESMKAIHQILDEENRNGILKNSIKKGKCFYQRLGWQKIQGVPKPWEFRLKDNISPHALRRVVDMVKDNFTK